MSTQIELISLLADRPQNFVWFLGAGTSRMAGLATATDVIWDLKLRHYCKVENQDLSKQDAQSEEIRHRVQSYMDANGFPPLWHPDEYTAIFDKVFGDDRERQRRYLKAKLSEENITLTAGPRVLAALMKMGASRAAFTTNFDTVIEKAFADVTGGSLMAYHLEGAKSAVTAFRNEEFPLYCKLHGDFRYDSIKNLESDLAKQNDDLATCFLDAADRYGVVVAGYSGRDQSVMELFERALEARSPFPHGLYWTTIRGAPVNPAVAALLEKATTKGIKCGLVEIETFDTFMLRVWRQLPTKPQNLEAKVRRSTFTPVAIPLPNAGTKEPIIRLNALRISELPRACGALNLVRDLDWDEVRQAAKDSRGSVVLTRGDAVLSWGRRLSLDRVLGAKLRDVTAVTLPTNIESPENFHVKRFLAEGFCFAVTRRRALMARMKRNSAFLIVPSASAESEELSPLRKVVGSLAGTVPDLTALVSPESSATKPVTWAEALEVSIEYKNGRHWLLLEPDVWIFPTSSREAAVDFLDKRKSNRFNKAHTDILNAWIQIILGSDARNAEVTVSAFDQGDATENPTFRVMTRSAFARRLVV